MQIKALGQILARNGSKPPAANASRPSFCISEVSGEVLESHPDKFFDIVAAKSGPAYAVCNSVPAAKLNAFLAAGKSALMREAASGALYMDMAKQEQPKDEVWALRKILTRPNFAVL